MSLLVALGYILEGHIVVPAYILFYISFPRECQCFATPLCTPLLAYVSSLYSITITAFPLLPSLHFLYYVPQVTQYFVIYLEIRMLQWGITFQYLQKVDCTSFLLPCNFLHEIQVSIFVYQNNLFHLTHLNITYTNIKATSYLQFLHLPYFLGFDLESQKKEPHFPYTWQSQRLSVKINIKRTPKYQFQMQPVSEIRVLNIVTHVF